MKIDYAIKVKKKSFIRFPTVEECIGMMTLLSIITLCFIEMSK